MGGGGRGGNGPRMKWSTTAAIKIILLNEAQFAKAWNPATPKAAKTQSAITLTPEIYQRGP